jgi:hypothetical protein
MLKTNSKENSRKGKRYVEKISNAVWATLKYIIVSLEEEDFDLDLFWTPPKSPSIRYQKTWKIRCSIMATCDGQEHYWTTM